MNKFILSFLFSITGFICCAQLNYSSRLEIGYLPYLSQTIKVEPGPTWKGYELDNKQNGLQISAINGINIKERLFVGVGVSYLNYEGINGYSFFGDIKFLTSKKRLSPLLNFRAGDSKLNNQYENGSKSGTVEFAAGINYKMTSRFNIYAKAGFMFAHGATFSPIRIGVGI
ncbi:MAG: hypothetical protein WC622_08430 [Pedobacter sp.]|jgi:hypothetical protein|uniref:hypothetical protein n=1 Tax=Pedobacter sp. TaxID=1411316 RepID=UPI003568B3C7